MRILITGICGFAGSTLAVAIRENWEGVDVFGFDNFVRPGSELNRAKLQKLGIRVTHADLRSASDMESIAPADWVIDAAANPSVLAGVDGCSSSRQAIENNLYGTVNVLEYCKAHRAGFMLLSTSRVYSIPGLSNLKVEEVDGAYRPVASQQFPTGVTLDGVTENYSTSPPLSLYGAAKLASECLAMEYSAAFNFPVWINRCGVLAGAGQFGRPDQGIFSFWIHSWLHSHPLKYIGFNGHGAQVRDCLHPRDVVPLLRKQIMDGDSGRHQICNVSGGLTNSISLSRLSAWCAARFGPREVGIDAVERAFDIPWMVLDSSRAAEEWGWGVQTSLETVLGEIADHAERNPDWLQISAS